MKASPHKRVAGKLVEVGGKIMGVNVVGEMVEVGGKAIELDEVKKDVPLEVPLERLRLSLPANTCGSVA